MLMMRNLFVYIHAINHQSEAQFCKVIFKRRCIFIAHRVP